MYQIIDELDGEIIKQTTANTITQARRIRDEFDDCYTYQDRVNHCIYIEKKGN